MFQNLLLIMSLSGTSVCIIYILQYPLLKRYVSLKWRYRMLKTALLFFLIPFPECKFQLIVMLHKIFPGLSEKNINTNVFLDLEEAVIVYTDRIWLSEKVRNTYVILLIMVVIALFIMGKRMLQYKKMMRGLSDDPGIEIDRKHVKLFTEIKKELGIRKSIRFWGSEYCRTPMTVGIRSSSVIFPVWDEAETDDMLYGDMIRHELVHIKHHDLLIRFMGMLVMAVHWFNPFSYFLYYELANISEMYCDSVVMEGKGQEERSRYSNLIIDLATESNGDGRPGFFAGVADNSRNKRGCKRRILEMKINRKYKTVLSVIMMGIICTVGGMTVFAYDKPVTFYCGEKYDDNIEFTISTEAPEQVKEELPYDCFFTDINGTIYDAEDHGEISKTICKHEYISGITTRHRRDGKGGCALEKYEAQICKICHNVKTGNLISTYTYVKCPHE